MGAHLIAGEFQSDKYPSTPRGKVPLSVKDPEAQPLLWQYAATHEGKDKEFSEDLRAALVANGYVPDVLHNAYGLALYSVYERAPDGDDVLEHWIAAADIKEARDVWMKMAVGMYNEEEFRARYSRLMLKAHDTPLPAKMTLLTDDGRGTVSLWAEFMAQHTAELVASSEY